MASLDLSFSVPWRCVGDPPETDDAEQYPLNWLQQFLYSAPTDLEDKGIWRCILVDAPGHLDAGSIHQELSQLFRLFPVAQTVGYYLCSPSPGHLVLEGSGQSTSKELGPGKDNTSPSFRWPP